MDTQRIAALGRQFERIGARLMVETSARVAGGYALDIAQRNGGRGGSRSESFVLRVRPDTLPVLDIQVLETVPERRHLLLLARGDADAIPERPVVKAVAASPEQGRFLCGHDERHWFVAAVPEDATRVREAMELLKPQGISRRQHQEGVRARDWNRRKNPVFLRQGEWFFLPMPTWNPPSELMVLHDEPIRRTNGGKPHRVEFLYRDGGQEVYVAPQRPRGLLGHQYTALLARQPEAASWNWQVMRRNPRVYARGKVRHADHATILLPCWHQVLMNGERLSSNVAFLD